MKKRPKMVKFWPFFIISRPPFIFFNFFLFCWVCVIRAVILNTINLDFMAIFFPQKNHLRGEIKLAFCHFRQRRWTFEIFSFSKSVLFLWHTPKIIWGKYIFKLFIFSHRPTDHHGIQNFYSCLQLRGVMLQSKANLGRA